MGLLGLYVGSALFVSFVCSVLEAALLSIRVTELADRRDRGDRAAAALLAIKEHRVGDAISAILTLNTVAHTIGAALAGAQAAVVFGDRWVGAFSGVLTLLILVLTEIIPKTLGTTNASGLVAPVAWSLRLLLVATAPALVVTRLLTRLFSKESEQSVSRGELSALVAIAHREGVIRNEELRVMTNLLRFDEVRVTDVMTPRTVAAMLPLGATVGELVDDAAVRHYSRVPVFEGSRDHVVGYVLRRDALEALVRGEPRGAPVAPLVRPIHALPEMASLSAALRDLQARRDPIAVVVDEFGGVRGLLTLEDVIETILGVEIIDEKDRVADLRAVALELRDKRMARFRDVAAGAPAGPSAPAPGPGAPGAGEGAGGAPPPPA